MSVTFDVGIWDGDILDYIDEAAALNVSNVSARTILEIGGFDSYELLGHMTAKQAREIADKLEEDSTLITQPSESYGLNGAHIINMGTDMDRIRNWAYWLRKVADDAEKFETYIVRYG